MIEILDDVLTAFILIPHCKSVHLSDQAFSNKAFRLLVLLVTFVSITRRETNDGDGSLK